MKKVISEAESGLLPKRIDRTMYERCLSLTAPFPN